MAVVDQASRGRASARALLTRATTWWQSTEPWRAAITAWTAPVWRPLTCVRPLGWTVLALGLMGWALAHRMGWGEFAVLAAAALAFFILALTFTVGRMRVLVTLEVTPQRVQVGEVSMARFEITNNSLRPLLALGVELPIGESGASYTTPVLGSNESYEDWVTIPTFRRGVVTVGPLQTQRGDPFGLVRRQVVWANEVTLYIHPKVTPIDPFGTGLLRDLEGQSTNDVSASDLAFHALRDYIPGDDQRHIHWKSSARLSALSGETRFMVRQFLDTRRSHVIIVTDVNEDVYANNEQFELAMSCGASVAVRAIQDSQDLTVVCGSHKQAHPAPHIALDNYSRAGYEPTTVGDTVRRLGNDIIGDASLLVVVTGEDAPFHDLQMVRSLISMQVRMVVIRVGQAPGIVLRETSGFTEVSLSTLADLPRALRGGVLV